MVAAPNMLPVPLAAAWTAPRTLLPLLLPFNCPLSSRTPPLTSCQLISQRKLRLQLRLRLSLRLLLPPSSALLALAASLLACGLALALPQPKRQPLLSLLATPSTAQAAAAGCAGRCLCRATRRFRLRLLRLSDELRRNRQHCNKSNNNNEQ